MIAQEERGGWCQDERYDGKQVDSLAAILVEIEVLSNIQVGDFGMKLLVESLGWIDFVWCLILDLFYWLAGWELEAVDSGQLE